MAEYYIHPDSVIYKDANVTSSVVTNDPDWSITKYARDPDAPDETTYITSPHGQVNYVVFGVSPIVKSPITQIDQMTLHLYAEAPALFTIEADLMDGVTVVGSCSIVGTKAWDSDTWVSGDLDQNDLLNLKIRITFTGTAAGSAGLVYAAYVHVETTESSVTYTPTLDISTTSTGCSWRPKLYPGHFWV